MNKSQIEILMAYEQELREILLDRISKGPKPGNSYQAYVRNSLKLNTEMDWNFLVSAMFLVGDTCLAIEHFLQFGLSGRTGETGNKGEEYLRLYGFLSTTYLQQNSVLKIYEKLQVLDLKSAKDSVKLLAIRELRNKLAAHSIDHLNSQSNGLETFVPFRITMRGFEFDYEYHDGNESKKHHADLKPAIEDHLRLMIDLYDKAFEKQMSTLYSSNPDKLSSTLAQLEKLRKLKNSVSPPVRELPISTYYYATEKFVLAIHVLATGKGSVKDRLFYAYQEFSAVTENELPAELRADFVWIKHELTKKEATVSIAVNGEILHGVEGRLNASLRSMKVDHAVTICERIYTLAAELNKITRNS